MVSGDSESAFSGLGRQALIAGMHEQLDELASARGQLEQLLAVIVELGSDLDLEPTLHRIVVAAMKLTSARYGALAVRDPDGTLASFVYAGFDEETVRRIGRLPVGKGVTDVSLVQTNSLRLDDLTTHPAAVGFPEHHPMMYALLSVPIVIRGTLFGNLYLTHEKPSRLFTEADEAVVGALAAAAAVAVDNARTVERLRASLRWIDASRDITTALLSDAVTRPSPLRVVVERVCELAEAEQAILAVPADADLPGDEAETLIVAAAAGLHAAAVIDQQIPVVGSTIGSVLRSDTAVITESFHFPIPGFTDVGQRSAIVVTLRADGDTLGVLAVARNQDQSPFDDTDLELVNDFARRAAIALVVATGRQATRERDILADRERIAHGLHDHVIQQLFAAGLDLQATIARVRSPEVVARLDRTVDDLQNVIGEIRSTIFRLKSRSVLDGDLRQWIDRAVGRLAANRGIVTTVRVDGPLTVVDDELAEHAEAVIMEAVSNACRHSGATRLSVDVRVDDALSIVITDNGRGIPADNQRRSGLANLLDRAQQTGGSCQIDSPPEGGTRVHWRAPLTAR